MAKHAENGSPSILGLQTTRQLLEGLQVDRPLRSLCDWNSPEAAPHESTFSRTFAEFSASELPQHLHEAIMKDAYQKDMPQPKHAHQ